MRLVKRSKQQQQHHFLEGSRDSIRLRQKLLGSAVESQFEHYNRPKDSVKSKRLLALKTLWNGSSSAKTMGCVTTQGMEWTEGEHSARHTCLSALKMERCDLQMIYVALLTYSTYSTVQGDTSGSSQPLVDIKTKVAFQYKEHIL